MRDSDCYCTSFLGCMFDHWVTFIPPEVEAILIYSSKCAWLSQMVHILLFPFYGSCLKGFGSENRRLLQRTKSASIRQWVSSQHILVCPTPECQAHHLLQSQKNCPMSMACTHLSMTQTLLDRQTGRHVSRINSPKEERAPAAVVKLWL